MSTLRTGSLDGVLSTFGHGDYNLVRATTSEWAGANVALILAQNQLGLDTTTGELKVGDGTNVWASLPALAFTSPTLLSPSTSSTGIVLTRRVAYTENATNTLHTGTVTLPAGSWLHNIEVTSSVLWTGGTATMKVGDTADDDGFFVGIDLKATDLLVGEVLSIANSTNWGGKEGAYLVAATGRRGPTSTNFGTYYAAGSDIKGIVTVGTPATTAGRTWMSVTFSIGTAVAAVASA